MYYDFDGEDHNMEEDSGEEDGPDDDLDDIGISRSFPIILMYCIWFHLTTLSTPNDSWWRIPVPRQHEGVLLFQATNSWRSFNVLFHAGRLFQQFAVDMYVKVEWMRLDWYAKPAHHDIIRANLYQVRSI